MTYGKVHWEFPFCCSGAHSLSQEVFFLIICQHLSTDAMFRTKLEATFLSCALLLCSVEPVFSQWGVWVTFENNCRRPIQVSVYGDKSGTVYLDSYEERSFDLCYSACTGWFGAGKTYYYSYSAETQSSRYDCYWSSKVRP